MKKITLLSFVLFVLVNKSMSQGFSAFTDQNNRFFVFDNGTKQQVEPLLPQSYKVGKNCVAYVNTLGIFKVYKDGNLNTINDNYTYDYGVSENLIYYKTVSALSVIDNNQIIELTRWVGAYKVTDSLAFYFDKNKHLLNVYQDGKTEELENNLANDTVYNYQAVNNIVAYTNYANQFKIYHQHHVQTAETNPVNEFKVGRNTVAYVDFNNQFKIFYNGNVYHIDGFAPKSFQVGNDIVAFVSYDGYFKIFYKGETQTIGFFEKKYNVTNNLVAYEDGNNFLKIFYQGNSTNVDNFFPSTFLSSYNSFAYIDKANTLKLFQNGKSKEVTSILSNLDDAKLDYDVLQYKIGLSMFKFCTEAQDY